MPTRTKTRDITITENEGAFEAIFKKFSKDEKKNYDFEGLAALRHVLSNERERLMSVVKYRKPNSIYSLAKLLGRDFKSVNDDVRLLERFGFIDMVAEKTGKRERLKPVIAVDEILIRVKI